MNIIWNNQFRDISYV